MHMTADQYVQRPLPKEDRFSVFKAEVQSDEEQSMLRTKKQLPDRILSWGGYGSPYLHLYRY